MTMKDRALVNALRGFGIASFSAIAVFTGAQFAAAGGLYSDDSLKDAPMPAGTKLEFSFNAGGTTDYVFRGFSQSDENPAFFGGMDITYGMFYVGVWASQIDFGPETDERVEVDLYGGIKKSFNGVDFDLGVIYYGYPNQTDGVPEQDYVEIKFGTSAKIWHEITAGATFYYSPEYFAETGETITSEGSLSAPLPSVMGHTFELSGTFGYIEFLDSEFEDDSYAYWNVGISKTIMDHFTFDVRYWDTDVSGVDLADERIVGTLTVAN